MGRVEPRCPPPPPSPSCSGAVLRREAIAAWVETATAVAVRLSSNDEVEMLAPHGVADLVQLVLRPTPTRRDWPLLRQRTAQKRWLERWPHLRFAEAEAESQE